MAKRMTIEDAAIALHVKAVTVYAWIRDNRLPRREWGKRGLYLLDTDLGIAMPQRGRPPKDDKLTAHKAKAIKLTRAALTTSLRDAPTAELVKRKDYEYGGASDLDVD